MAIVVRPFDAEAHVAVGHACDLAAFLRRGYGRNEDVQDAVRRREIRDARAIGTQLDARVIGADEEQMPRYERRRFFGGERGCDARERRTGREQRSAREERPASAHVLLKPARRLR